MHLHFLPLVRAVAAHRQLPKSLKSVFATCFPLDQVSSGAHLSLIATGISTEYRPRIMEPFTINVDGRAEIPHPAERALIDVVISSSGNNKASVSEEVLTTAKHVENLLGELSPQDESPEAMQAAPLAHWSKTSLTATSHVPYDDNSNPLARQYDASIQFDIRFKEFKALGAFGARLSALSHVEVRSIRWILTDATEKSYRARLRKEAALDALEKARDYCEVLDCSNVRPLELEEVRYFSGAASYGRNTTRYAQSPGSMRMQSASRSARESANDARDESPLEFKPEEVKMSMEIRVKFHAR